LKEPLLTEKATGTRKSKVKNRKGSDAESGLTVDDLLITIKSDPIVSKPRKEDATNENENENENEIPKQTNIQPAKQTSNQPFQQSQPESSSEGSGTDEEDYFP